MKKQDPAGAGKGKKMQKFKSVHEVMTNTKANILLHKPDSAKGLGSVWTKFMAEKTGTFQGKPTIKALGQLKVFATKCPPGKAEQVLLHTLPNWIAFTKRVEQDAGVKITPLLPSVDFLLKHASIAVMFAAPPKSSSPKHEATASIPIAEPAQLISLPKDEQVPTHEELLALINEPKEA